MQTNYSGDYPDNGKPEPKFKIPKFKLRPKQRYRKSDGTYGGYSGAEEGKQTIEAKRIRLAQNSGTTKRKRK